MRKIALTQGHYALVDDEDYYDLIEFKWQYLSSGYACRSVYKRLGRRQYKNTSVLMHREIARAKEGEEVDHKNRNRLDNRRHNLRICSRRENLLNRGLQRNNKTGERCVCWDSKKGRWLVQVKIDGRGHFLGRFKDIQEAKLARDSFEAGLTL